VERERHGTGSVNCHDRHKVEKNDPDALEHKELISILVTPNELKFRTILIPSIAFLIITRLVK
jgi:hypothetical protein